MNNSNKSCSYNSLQASEKMFGTAPIVNFWILIEYKHSWEEKAFNNSIIDKEVKEAIRKLAGRYTKSRIQLIKNSDDLSGIRLYIAICTQSEKKLFEFIIDSYNQILELDFEKVLTLENLKTIPLLLICTHGSYDQCCGTRGVELYNKLSAIEEKFDVWQTTHLGGHRFASNILLLPEGICYGRVNEDNYTLIKNQYSKHRVCSELLRGRCCYTAEVQAAEYFLTKEMNSIKFDDITLIENNLTDSGHYKVVFKNVREDSAYVVLIDKKDREVEIFASCKDKFKKSFDQYDLISIT